MGLARLFRVLQNLTLDFIHFIKVLLRCFQKRPRPIVDTKKKNVTLTDSAVFP